MEHNNYANCTSSLLTIICNKKSSPILLHFQKISHKNFTPNTSDNKPSGWNVGCLAKISLIFQTIVKQ